MPLAPVRVVLAIVLAAASAARADEPSRPGALLDVPFVAQTEALCGGASVAMVQRYWGAREVSAADFASLVDSRLNGIPASRLADAVQRQGWQAFASNGTPDFVRHHVESGRPIIALLQVGPNQRHYVVVVSWSADRVLYRRSGQPSLQDTLSCCVRQAVGAHVEMDVAAPASPGADDSRANDGSFSARARVGAD